jgi:uncharacterized membrane protein YdbT with pleckstrin-like domain
MRYINSTLLREEKIVFATRPHWIVFGPTVISLILSLLIWIYGADKGALNLRIAGEPFYAWASWFCLAMALYLGVRAWVMYMFSEYGITNKRVIMKTGVIQRDAFETFLPRVEGINVWQSVIGRVINYGTITVVGTGGTRDSFPQIPDPIHFRQVIQQQIDNEMKEFSGQAR